MKEDKGVTARIVTNPKRYLPEDKLVPDSPCEFELSGTEDRRVYQALVTGTLPGLKLQSLLLLLC